jgi:hypothetical protein
MNLCGEVERRSADRLTLANGTLHNAALHTINQMCCSTFDLLSRHEPRRPREVDPIL